MISVDLSVKNIYLIKYTQNILPVVFVVPPDRQNQLMFFLQ